MVRGNLEARLNDVVHLDQPDHFLILAENRQDGDRPVFVRFHNGEGMAGHFIAHDVARRRRHQFAHFHIEGFRPMLLQRAPEVAVGEDPLKAQLVVGDQDAAAFLVRQLDEGMEKLVRRTAEGQSLVFKHQVIDAQRQPLADPSRGMVHRIFIQGEVFVPEQCDGKDIAKEELRDGRGRGNKIERAKFFAQRKLDGEVASPCQTALAVIDDGNGKAPFAVEGGDHLQEFVALAAFADHEEDIVFRNDADVAMHGADGIEEESAGSGGGHRGGHLLGDEGAFADAGEEDQPFARFQLLKNFFRSGMIDLIEEMV